MGFELYGFAACHVEVEYVSWGTPRSSRTPRRIRRIRYFALFSAIFAPLSQGTVSNSLWSSQHLSRYRIDSPGTFPSFVPFDLFLLPPSYFFFLLLSFSLFSFPFVSCCAHPIGLGINREGFFFTLKDFVSIETKSIVIFNSSRDFDVLSFHREVSFRSSVKISGQ